MYTKDGRQRGLNGEAKLTIIEATLKDKLTSTQLMGILEKKKLDHGVSEMQIKNFMHRTAKTERRVEEFLNDGLARSPMPETREQFLLLEPGKLFSLDFSFNLLEDDIKSRIPSGILSKIENDSQRVGIFSTRWFMEDWDEATRVYNGNLSISADGIWSDSSKGRKYCLIPIGTHSNAFDYNKGKGHTKEFRPFFFVIGTGESSAMVIAAFVAAQNFAIKRLGINFKFEDVCTVQFETPAEPIATTELINFNHTPVLLFTVTVVCSLLKKHEISTFHASKRGIYDIYISSNA
ncbi:unnamed protein product [Bathycoccus prasinos]